jgi:KaiC/GvpD/RAD55 family RecA-like ATPase
MVENLKIEAEWLKALLPEGLPRRTSTLLSGPGGTGKPLIGDQFVASWLREGGSVVFMSLQYPTTAFIYESLKTITGLNIEDYLDRIVFLSLDVDQEGMAEPDGNIIRVNLVKPDVMNAAIEKACTMLGVDDSEILIFGSALNLLLFSPTYEKEITQKIESFLRDDKRRTYIFSVSTTAKAETIAEFEKLADNLVMTRSEGEPFKLYMRFVRVKGSVFKKDEIQVPISASALKHMKEIADHSRKRIIPQISRI